MDLFVYGTLLSHGLMAAVAGPGSLSSLHAQLDGHRVAPLRDDVVPCIVSGDGSINGILWTDLTDAQFERLDLYEGAFGYQLQDITVVVDGSPRTVKCYFPPHSPAVGEGKWSLAAWEADHLAPAILAAAELFSHQPLPDKPTLRRMWPMIETRAWSKHRAIAAPATIRRRAVPDDLDISAEGAPHGAFFRMQSLEVNHQRFDGTRSDTLIREAFHGVDAALVLPYDPVRDKLLLVEQFRMGPAARRDPNPWMLEPVAGIVDARETPQAAAHREAQEEAGVTLTHLEPAGAYYPSPGATTDFFYCYVGLCDLPMTESYFGGLPQENEDLRLHPVSFAQAMKLAQTGEIAVGPLQHLIYWLAYHRDGLRKMI